MGWERGDVECWGWGGELSGECEGGVGLGETGGWGDGEGGSVRVYTRIFGGWFGVWRGCEKEVGSGGDGNVS